MLGLKKAKDILNNDGVVGIPTETVYGLAASINSPQALKKIFATKRRPFFDPLIVHVHNIEQARQLSTDWNEAAEVLAKHFWPGPLTLVLAKSEKVDDIITAGLDAVGIRMPNHPLALQLIEAVGSPLAAPSANLFGKTSPTTAQHVQSEFGPELFVLDGGPCQIGLESTVLWLRQEEQSVAISLLRAGHIRLSEIESVLKSANVQYHRKVVEKKAAPGQMKHHYMPNRPLILLSTGITFEQIKNDLVQRWQSIPEVIDEVKIIRPKKFEVITELLLPVDPTEAARQLYSTLRILSEGQTDLIYFKLQPYHQDETWEGILDRLKKAASLIF